MTRRTTVQHGRVPRTLPTLVVQNDGQEEMIDLEAAVVLAETEWVNPWRLRGSSPPREVQDREYPVPLAAPRFAERLSQLWAH